MSDYPLESFVFYRSFRDAISEMSDDNKLATLLAICDYALYGVEPKLKDAMARAVFTVARPSIDANKDRRTNGKKGGRPPKKPMVSDSENQWFPKTESTETESVSESGSVSGAGAETKADKPPCPPSLPDTPFGPELQSAFDRWLSYKRERREGYKPTGLNALVTQIKNNAATYGEHSVAKLIETSMASGWKGIAFDRLKQGNKPQAADRNRLRTEADYGDDDFFKR